MNSIVLQAHQFLQNFCRNNPVNQKILHDNLSLFMQSGDNVSTSMHLARDCANISMYLARDYVSMFMYIFSWHRKHASACS